MSRWIQAGGPHQFPFIMDAASRSLMGERDIDCPRRHRGTIRAYFHMFKPAERTGTIWVWCAECRTTAHLPRVTPQDDPGLDHYASLSIDQFAEFEGARFLDRLERLWQEGTLGMR